MFSATRQPLPIVLLTLLAILLSALYFRVDTPLVQGAETEYGTSLTHLVLQFERQIPKWATILTGVIIFMASLMVSRIGARHSLYRSGTLLPIPIYVLASLGIILSDTIFSAALGGLLFVRSVRNFSSSYRSGFAFEYIFRGSLYLSLLILLSPCALPLLLLFPIALLNFKRTFRESIVALVGLLLPIFLLCYYDWAIGMEFLTPFKQIAGMLYEAPKLNIFYEASILLVIELGLYLAMSLCAVFYFLGDRYSMLSKSRTVLTFQVWAFALCLSILFVPGANLNLFMLISLPVSLLLPYLFVTIRPLYSNVLYVILLLLYVLHLVVL